MPTGENWFYPISNRDRPLIEQDETGAIVWVTNTTLPQTQLDGYFIYKKTNAELPDGGRCRDLHHRGSSRASFQRSLETAG